MNKRVKEEKEQEEDYYDNEPDNEIRHLVDKYGTTKNKIAMLGLGNISYELCSSLINRGFIVSGTTNNFDRKHKLQELGVKVFSHNQILKCISNSTKIIYSYRELGVNIRDYI